MLKCSYIVLVHNNERTISRVIDSLKKINGNFRREFIIIDDGSEDESLNIIKNSTKNLLRTTILTQDHLGSSISINKGISLVKADYIHFIDGVNEVLPDTTAELIQACVTTGSEVAFINNCVDKNFDKKNTIRLIDEPLKEILINKVQSIRNIGLQGSLVSYNLFKVIKGADEEIYNLNPSISLRCAMHSKFVSINKQLAYSEVKEDPKFRLYNDLLAVHNCIEQNPEAFKDYRKELLYNLFKNIETTSSKIYYFTKYLLTRYFNKYDLSQIIKLYRKELKKLF